MEHFPIFLTLSGRRCLVVGGGEMALEKVERLLAARADLVVVAPRAVADLEALATAGELRWERRAYATDHLDDAQLVIAATGVREVDATVSREAQARRLPVNVVDVPALCTFIVPSIVDRGPVVVAISTGGASPSLARSLRLRIESVLPEGMGALASLLRARREAVRARLPDAAARKAFWDRVVGGEVADLALSDRLDQARQTLDAWIARLGASDRDGR